MHDSDNAAAGTALAVESLRAALPSPGDRPNEDTTRAHVSFGTWLSVFSGGRWRCAQVIDASDNLLCVSFTDEDEEDMWIDRGSPDVSLDALDNMEIAPLTMTDASPPHTPTNQPSGLANHGNMCFLNSLLQMLYSTPQFRDLILRTPPANTTEQSLIECFEQLDRRDGATGDASALLDAIGLEAGQQQDIQQVYLLLMDLIESHPATDCVTGSTLHTLRFKNEQRASVDKFHCLSLDVLGHETLEQSLAAWEAAEHIHDFDWDDQTCAVTITKQSTLTKLPPVLVCHLHRFALNYDTWATEKVESRLSFPLVFPSWEEFELRGIVVHCGGEASSGHYKTYVNTNHSWTELNDSLVRPWDVRAQLETDCFGGPGTDQCAYLLLYERTGNASSEVKNTL